MQRDEKDIIAQHINYDQNTHNRFLTRSAGIAALKLQEIYFKDLSEDDKTKEYEACKKQLKQYAAEAREAKDSLLVLAIECLIASAEEPLHRDLDRVILYLPQPTDAKNTEVRYQEKEKYFPLKEILTSVWMALHDDDRFFKDEKAAGGTQALTDRQLRLSSFRNRLKTELIYKNKDDDKWYKICHTGVRHLLLTELNKTHKDIEICIDGNAEILSFLKDNLAKLFWEKYKKADAQNKKMLLLGLFYWLSENNVEKLATVLDPQETMLKQLQERYIQHGSGPDEVENSYRTALKYLQYGYDSQRDKPAMRALIAIFEAFEKPDNLRKAALLKIRDWIFKNFDLENPGHIAITDTFQIFYHCHKLLEDYDFLIQLLDKKEEFSDLAQSCIRYFEEVSQGTSLPEMSPDLLAKAQTFLTFINQAKSETLQNDVENYFARWFVAFDAKDTQGLKHLYNLLLDPKTSSKLICDDETIERFQKVTEEEESKEGIRKVRNIGPYVVNRIFLHAIMVPPEDWTDAFTKEFELILKFVEETFTTDSWIASHLKRDSYREPLLKRLRKNLNVKKGVPEEEEKEEEKKGEEKKEHQKYDSDHDYFYLPEHVKNGLEWCKISPILPDDYRQDLYQSRSIKLNRYLAAVLQDLPYLKFREAVVKSIPEEQLMTFFNFYGLEKLMQEWALPSFTVSCIPEHIREDIFLAKLSNNFLHTQITRHDCLELVLMSIAVDKRQAFLERLLSPPLDAFFLNDPERLDPILRVLTASQGRWLLQQIKDKDFQSWFSDPQAIRYRLNGFNIHGRKIVLEKLGRECFYKIIVNSDHLMKLIEFNSLRPFYRTLHEDSIKLILQCLGSEILKSCLPDRDRLLRFMEEIPESCLGTFFDMCGDHVRGLLTDSRDISYIFGHRLKYQADVILNGLGNDHLRTLINSDTSSVAVAAAFKVCGVRFLERLGRDHLRSLITDTDTLKLFISSFSDNEKTEFLKFLGNQHIYRMLDSDLVNLIIPTWEQHDLDRYFDEMKTSPQQLWPHAHYLGETLGKMSPECRHKFISLLGDSFTKILVEDHLSLLPLLEVLKPLADLKESKSEDELFTLLTSIGGATLKQLFNRGKPIDYEDSVKLIKKLTIDKHTDNNTEEYRANFLYRALLYALTLAYVAERDSKPDYTNFLRLGAKKSVKLFAAENLLTAMKNKGQVIETFGMMKGKLGHIAKAYKEFSGQYYACNLFLPKAALDILAIIKNDDGKAVHSFITNYNSTVIHRNLEHKR